MTKSLRASTKTISETVTKIREVNCSEFKLTG